MSGPPRAERACASLGDDGATEVTREEPHARVAPGGVLDVRPAEEHRVGHIPGALSIPVGELADCIAELPQDAEIVVNCRGEHCVLAHDVVRLLTDRGRCAIRLNDGMPEWRPAELPVDTADLT
ncbi:rhodanese-like domain-containing protein [Streptomyces sp. NPDC048665]|uniref:rhodanese-like domain-containing protein n=1 Tax=Streptomyces sp. NPDC048665 TaxID=3155490 RepID=UPI00341706D4